jgi:hypothetical protein
MMVSAQMEPRRSRVHVFAAEEKLRWQGEVFSLSTEEKLYLLFSDGT